MRLFHSPADGASLPAGRPAARLARPWIESKARGLVSVHGPAEDPFGGTLGRIATTSLLAGTADAFRAAPARVAAWVWERLGDASPGLRPRWLRAVAETVRWLCDSRSGPAFASVLPYRPRTGGGSVVRAGVTSRYLGRGVTLRPRDRVPMSFGERLPINLFDFVEHGYGSDSRGHLRLMTRANDYAPAGAPPYRVTDAIVCPVARGDDRAHLRAGLIAPLAAHYFDAVRGLWLCPHVLLGAVGHGGSRYTSLVHLCLSAEGRLVSLSTNERSWADFGRYFPAYGPMLAATGMYDGPQNQG